jgi:hypothetical protein
LRAELGSKGKAALLSSQTRLASDFADLLWLPLTFSTALYTLWPTLFDVRTLPESGLSPIWVSWVYLWRSWPPPALQLPTVPSPVSRPLSLQPLPLCLPSAH